VREYEDSLVVRSLRFCLTSLIWTLHLWRLALDLMRFIYGFAFSCVEEAVDFNVIMGIKSDADPISIFPVFSNWIEMILCYQFVKYIESWVFCHVFSLIKTV
jgi:hypothetical protein